MPDSGLVVNTPIEVPPEPTAPLTEGAVYVEALPNEVTPPGPPPPGEPLVPDFSQPDPQTAQLQQELERYRQAEILQGLQRQAGDYVQRLVQQGWQPEQAQAEAVRQLRTHVLELSVEQHRNQATQMLKIRAAEHLAQRHGVEVADLMMAQTPEDMQKLAVKLEGRDQQTRNFNERLGRVESRMAPPQRYDSNRGSQQGVRVTSDNIDALYNQGRVTDAVYRRFLETGRI